MRRLTATTLKVAVFFSMSICLLLLTYVSIIPHNKNYVANAGANRSQTSCDNCTGHAQQTVLYTFNQTKRVVRLQPLLPPIPYWLQAQLPLWLLYVFPFLAIVAIGYSQTRILLSVQLRY